MELLVVGAGEMGRWFARHAGADAVAFADRDHEAARAAADALAGSDRANEGGQRPTEATVVSLETDRTFDAVCLAVPMSQTPEAIAAHVGKAKAAVVDVAGEMRDAVAAQRQHAPALEHASFHPLFAPRNAPGNLPVVVDRDGPTVTGIQESLAAAGNRVFETTPAEHDAAMETVQAKAHTAILAYALAAEDVDPRFHTAVSGPLEDVVEATVGGSGSVYAEIQRRFDGGEGVADAARRLADADAETFAALYEEAGE